MTKIFNITLNILSVLFTVILIIFLIYRKIIINTQKVDINLQNIEGYILFFQTLLFFSVLLTLGYFFILFVKIKNNSSGFLTDKFNGFLFLIQKYNPIYHCYNMIFNKINPKYTYYLVRITKYLLAFSAKTNTLIILFGVSAPRVLISFVLLFDILILQKLHYYFFALILLIIPLSFRFIIFIFTDLSKKLLPEFKKYLNFGKPEAFYGNLDSNIKNSENIEITLKPQYKDMDLNHVLYNFYYPMLFLQGHMELEILPQYRKISCYTQLIYYLVHSCSWFYILITV